MKIAIIGYGRIGQEIEAQAISRNLTVSKKINSKQELINAQFDKNEIAIEFTEPCSAIDNINILAKKNVSIVVGTTGWHDKIDTVKKIVKENNIGLLYASNFSLGVNIFWHILEKASSIINNFNNYDLFTHEYHHKNKLDSPSGTALTTAEIITKNVKRKSKIITEALNRKILDNELHVSSTRGGGICGIHKVFFDSYEDTISISHDAKNRSGFAVGAIECALWLNEKKECTL